MKNPTKTQQIKMLDRQWSLFIRSYGRCENCGKTQPLECSHIIGRAYIKTRFDPRNLQCLCKQCHGVFTHNPIMFAEFVRSSSCGQYVDIMQQQGHDTKHKPDYQLWQTILEAVTRKQLTVPQSREWLAQQPLWTLDDLCRL